MIEKAASSFSSVLAGVPPGLVMAAVTLIELSAWAVAAAGAGSGAAIAPPGTRVVWIRRRPPSEPRISTRPSISRPFKATVEVSWSPVICSGCRSGAGAGGSHRRLPRR